MGGFLKKICKEISRPFRRASKSAGKFARHVGGRKFGNFIERAFNTVIDTAATCGAGIFGGPAGVAAVSAILAASHNLSDKDIFKASIVGGASYFVSILSNELIAAKGIGMQTIATTGLMNGTIAACNNKNILHDMTYGYAGSIAPNNPLIIAAMKTIAEKDIDSGLLHIVGFETGQYLQGYINTTKAIDKHIKQEDKEIFEKRMHNNQIKKHRIECSIKKDVDMYNLVKNDLLEPYKKSMETDYVTKNHNIHTKFKEIHEKINDNMWKLKTRIAMKTNEVNSSLVYQISPTSGINITTDINKHLGLSMGTDEWSVSAGLSNIYPRGFVVKYATTKQLSSNVSNMPTISNKFLDKTIKGFCQTTKTYNTTNVSTDGITNSTMTTEYHTNADCIIGAGIGATAIVSAPQIIIPMLGSTLGPALACASNNKTKSLKIADKVNSGTNPKLNYKIMEMLNDQNIVNKYKWATKK